MTAWKDRVKELRRVPASSLIPHPKNWRTHSPGQREAMRAVLSDVGFAGAMLCYEDEDARLVIIDGHMRQDELGNQEVPCLVLDVTEAEARKLLVTFDPIAAMAEADTERLDALLREVETDQAGLQKLLDELAAENKIDLGEPAETPKSQTLAERFGVPPFSVLDARQGYWQDRKRAWLSLGIQSEIGRGGG